LEEDAQLTLPSKKTLGDLPDTLLSAKKMDLFPLLNPKSYLTVTTQLMSAKKSLKEF
jgi:hypothetical protein